MDAVYEYLGKYSYYVVLIITLIVWLGLFLYMRALDKKVKKLEK